MGKPRPRNRVPRTARVAVLELDDPRDAPACLTSALRAPPLGAKGFDGPAEWYAPTRPQIQVVAALRDDVAAKMYARRQIDRASYLASRQYQALYEQAAPTHMRSVDISMPPINGLRSAENYGPADAQLRADARLKEVHVALGRHCGVMGVQVLADVLAFGLTLEAVTLARDGAGDRQAARFWGGLFRHCLRHLAVILGLATANRRGRD
jgi:hypothetical protein